MKSSAKKVELASVDDLFSTEESRADAQREKVVEIPLSELHPFKGHPFKVKDDEAMMETADSIKQYGVLVPAIARPAPEGGYELVAGHRRHRASELAEKETMQVIVRDLDDDAATIIMVDSNLQRESLLPSERAFAYKMKLEAMKHQGERVDLTCAQVGHKLDGKKSRDKFGDLDDKESFKAMCDFAMQQDEVKVAAANERLAEAESDFADAGDDDWKKKLQRNKNGVLENLLHNIRLIMENDPYMKNIRFNQLADGMEICGEVPWKHPAKFWRDADDAQLICYVDACYGSFSQRNYDVAVTKAADDRSYHPIKDYFESLPVWDEIPRVDTVLIDYLGAQDNEYVRAVTRKALCAAYMRIYHPGIKFDYITVLNGEQGIGKSTLIAKLGMEWFADSLTLSDMNDKTAAEKLQGYWIHEIGEMAGMRKADLEKVKAFVSRCDDKYRASFGRRVTPHPRQCIFFGTTNSENGYLRDITGNRRFWNVRVPGTGRMKPWDLTQEIIDQIWAEVIVLAKGGEELFLSHELEEYAKKEQSEAMERDDREGLVARYLDMLLPETWDTMDVYQRREYVQDPDSPLNVKGTVRRETVSNIEIWCECFGKAKEDIKPSDSYALAAIMTRFGDWERTAKSVRLPIYGKQRVYQRK